MVEGLNKAEWEVARAAEGLVVRQVVVLLALSPYPPLLKRPEATLQQHHRTHRA